MASVYCFISGGSIKLIPLRVINENYNSENECQRKNLTLYNDVNSHTTTTRPSTSPEHKSLVKCRNLLYKLNNPSLSDIESDSATDVEGSSQTSHGVTTPGPCQQMENELTRIAENYNTHAIYLPMYYVDLSSNMNSDYGQIKDLLMRIFTQSWKDESDIDIQTVTGGITNMLLSCHNTSSGDTVLMRVYGPGTSLIIDRNREFVLHLVLQSLGLAPPIHARFKNGIVYGFLPGRSLEPKDLSNPSLYRLIAQQLGNWHRKVSIPEIEDGVRCLHKFTKDFHKRKKSIQKSSLECTKSRKVSKTMIDIWTLLHEWITIVPLLPELIDSFNEHLDIPVSEENIRHVIIDELSWLQKITSSITSPVVSAHCDLLSGNIIIPKDFARSQREPLPAIENNPVNFIDYEYMFPAPRAFDIANHFAEWQGFDCDRKAIPEPSKKNPTIVCWVSAYLDDKGNEEEIEGLIEEIKIFYGMPGFYWGIWAMIQSQISNIDFDYANYAKLRFEEYWDWKKFYLEMSLN